ncbi:hypothetical protein M433DRAFT_151028 [Acidomyces richmondensis BFW]|nr:MAG: hypothetical protein FE78DRAFT_84559 [Acidomyces sp. 'richmondensis']KYG48500.1 hypothetical protein M433DRAFT_151028 [Acidomyces richmondensis BFW]
MRLTTELIQNALSYLNPLNERELDLRGHQIPAIENLGAAADHESIDFTDNHISLLGNFPRAPRLQTLLCARNRISRIQTNLARSLPVLTTLVLTDNRLAELPDLDPLAHFPKLEHVVLVDNPVTKKEHYRTYLLWLAPQIRFLDFQKVKDAERALARDLFGPSPDAPTDLARSIRAAAHRSSTAPQQVAMFPNGGGAKRGPKLRLSDAEKARFEARLKKATTLAEVQQLEKMLSEGRLPPGVADGEEEDEEEDDVMGGT